MKKFIFWSLLFLIGGGLSLHFAVPIYGISFWMGKLPGDVSITKGNTILYLPFVSAALLGLIVTLIIYSLKPQKKE